MCGSAFHRGSDQSFCQNVFQLECYSTRAVKYLKAGRGSCQLCSFAGYESTSLFHYYNKQLRTTVSLLMHLMLLLVTFNGINLRRKERRCEKPACFTSKQNQTFFFLCQMPHIPLWLYSHMKVRYIVFYRSQLFTYFHLSFLLSQKGCG